MIKIPNRDYRFKRMMDKVIISCAPPSEYQNVAIVCLPDEKKEIYDKIMNYLDTNPRPMSLSAPHYFGTFNGTILIYRDTESSISLLSEPEDWHVRTFESVYIVCDVNKIKTAAKHSLASAIFRAGTAVNLSKPETYNWS